MNTNKLKKSKPVSTNCEDRSTFTNIINTQINNLETQEEIEFLLKSMNYIKKYSDEVRSSSSMTTDVSSTNVYIQDKEDLSEEDERVIDEVIEEEEEEDLSNIENFINKLGIVKKGEVYKEFMESCMNQLVMPDEQEHIKKCADCQSQDLLYIFGESELVCNECGACTFYQDFSLPSYSSCSMDSEFITQFSYKRQNHFREWLTQIAAKENTVIPESLLLQIMKELKKERITKVEDITNTTIRRYLKKIGMSKYYEHIPTIIDKICKKERVKISYETEQILLDMFKRIQTPFEKHCPKGRKNFLSYSYTLHKMCQIINRYDLLYLFPLLKSRQKLYIQDTIWKSICEELGWDFIPSV